MKTLTFDDLDINYDAVSQHTKSATAQQLDLTNIRACPRCGKGLIKTTSISGAPSSSFLECPECGTLINTFRPTNYQSMFLKRSERYKMTAGGFGSGKSRSNIEDVIKHLILIPGSRVCVTARTYPALDSTFVREFYSMFPKKLVRSKNDMKHEVFLTNGSELLFRSFDDPTKLKSMNLTMAVIVEASDVMEQGFTMLQTRIRNTAAMIPYYENGEPVRYWNEKVKEYRIKYRIDARHINLETNPDSGWVKKFLLESKTVEFYGDAYNEGYKFKNPDENKYTQIVTTGANPYLPENYEEEQTRGKSEAYIQQFFKGSFNFSSGLVFPNFGTVIVPPSKLPREFDERGRRVLYHLISLDYGVHDPTHILYAAYSLERRKLIVHSELRINNSDIPTIAAAHRKMLKTQGIDVNGLLMMPQFDGRSYGKRESNLLTIGEMFQDVGLFFEPNYSLHNVRIIKLNTLINHAQIEIYSTCEFLVDEGTQYKFKQAKDGTYTRVPKDGNDHGVTALGFMVTALPSNLEEFNIGAYFNGKPIEHDKQFEEVVKVKPYDPLEKKEVTHGNPNYNRAFGISSDNTDGSVYNEYEKEEADTDNANYVAPFYVPRTR